MNKEEKIWKNKILVKNLILKLNLKFNGIK